RPQQTPLLRVALYLAVARDEGPPGSDGGGGTGRPAAPSHRRGHGPAGAARARSRRTRGLVPRPDARQPVPLHSLALAADAAVAARASLAAPGVGPRDCTLGILSAAAV